MKRMSNCLMSVVMMFMFSGCAANMALTKGQENVDLTEKSIALASIRISNQNKPGYQPSLLYAFFFANSSNAEKTHIDLKIEPLKSEKDQYNEYLMSFSLKPGKYNFSQIWGNYKIPVLLNAMCSVPLNTQVEIKPNSVIYLGHIDATIRERKNDTEERAGSVIPLIDQSVAGFSSGTFDVVINDKFDEDIKAYIAEYPVLNKVQVEKAIMPQWVRPEQITAKKGPVNNFV
ncbi:MAG TPA: hypothetical protein VGJ93_01825 [Desulfuromonadaceae bacterium]